MKDLFNKKLSRVEWHFNYKASYCIPDKSSNIPCLARPLLPCHDNSCFALYMRAQVNSLYFLGKKKSTRFQATLFRVQKTDRSLHIFDVRLRSVFCFSFIFAKLIFWVFEKTGEKEYRQKCKVSWSVATLCRYSGGFQGRALPAFGERPCSQGLVSYTFCAARCGKGCCRHLDSSRFRSGKPNGFCEGMSRICVAFGVGAACEMKCSTQLRRRKRYIKPPSRRSDHASLIRFLRR